MTSDTQENQKSQEPTGDPATKEFTELSGKGDSSGWRFDREEIHERKEVPTPSVATDGSQPDAGRRTPNA